MTCCYPPPHAHTFYFQASKQEKLNGATKTHNIYWDEEKLENFHETQDSWQTNRSKYLAVVCSQAAISNCVLFKQCIASTLLLRRSHIQNVNFGAYNRFLTNIGLGQNTLMINLLKKRLPF